MTRLTLEGRAWTACGRSLMWRSTCRVCVHGGGWQAAIAVTMNSPPSATPKIDTAATCGRQRDATMPPLGNHPTRVPVPVVCSFQAFSCLHPLHPHPFRAVGVLPLPFCAFFVLDDHSRCLFPPSPVQSSPGTPGWPPLLLASTRSLAASPKTCGIRTYQLLYMSDGRTGVKAPSSCGTAGLKVVNRGRQLAQLRVAVAADRRHYRARPRRLRNPLHRWLQLLSYSPPAPIAVSFTAGADRRRWRPRWSSRGGPIFEREVAAGRPQVAWWWL